MTLPTTEEAGGWHGLTLVSADGEKIGEILRILVGHFTGQPSWALVHVDRDATRVLVPLVGAAREGGAVRVPYSAATILHAPRLDPAAELTEAEEARLSAHYGLEYLTAPPSYGGPAGEGAAGGPSPSVEYPSPSPSAPRWEVEPARPLPRYWRVPRPRRQRRRVEKVPAGVRLRIPRLRRRLPEEVLGGAPTEPRIPPPALPARTVSTGFADPADPDKPIPRYRCLAPDTDYVYWFEVGEPVADAIDEPGGRQLPLATLSPGTRLQVVLFAFEDELAIRPGLDVGELTFLADGSLAVARQPGGSSTATAGRRLRFPVHTPRRPGWSRLRCNLYYGQVLLQSRLVEARVKASRLGLHPRSLRSTVDFSVSGTLTQAQLAQLQPQRLSVMVNDNGDGTHGFRFFGENDLKGDVALDGQTLQNLLDLARDQLRWVSWGKRERWAPGMNDQYAGPADQQRLARHLISLARVGYRLYEAISGGLADAVAGQLTGSEELVDALTERMRRPGMIEIASKESVRLVLPAALLYDYPVDSNADLRLCPSVAGALAAGGSLADHECFNGDCPSYGDLEVMCPSGFWGFRHQLGLPPSLAGSRKGDAVDAPPTIEYADMPAFTVAVSMDSEFVRRELHEQALQTLRSPVAWQLGRTRTEALQLLARTNPQVVYFFCHGGLDRGTPYLLVGPPGEQPITRDNLQAYKIRWRSTRPLVFLNGCHTTALEPNLALDFVSAFVQKSHASGVIGTEVTVFEPLACDFAEECLRRFVVHGQPIGEAVRGARLALLARGNPLGLVYIAYVAPGLRLVAA